MAAAVRVPLVPSKITGLRTEGVPLLWPPVSVHWLLTMRPPLMLPGAQPAVVLDATWQVPYLRSI